MELDYNSFINGLLNNPSTTNDDRERIVTLLLKERDKGYVTEEKVLDLIKKYTVADDSKNIKSEEIEIHEPRQTYEFLSFFCRNDGGMKNLTHDFNFDYVEYDTFIKQCKKEFEEGIKKYPKVQKRLVSRIEEFAFKENPNWYIREGKEKKNIHYGWSEPNFIEWYKTSKLHPTKNPIYNNEMIIPFKDSIQVRSDTQNLVKMLNSLKTIVFGENPCCKVNIKDSVFHAQFYTDVDSLGQALYQIFITIKDRSENNFCDEVEIDYQEDSSFKTLFITHIGSEATKLASDKDYAGGNTKAIRSALWGICNYQILAKFPDGAFRKIILSDNRQEYLKKNFPISTDEVKGYTHVLKFY